MTRPKIVVIVGPTASGKTSLGIELAQRFGGEVVSADSRQVYQGLDIGTGKVTEEEMRGVPHHLLDVADPRDTYTVADFVEDGTKALHAILERGKLPIIVGGTFFYVDSLLGKVTLPDVPPNPELRRELETFTVEKLFGRLRAVDPRYAELVDRDNPRRLIRAIEITEDLGSMPKLSSTLLYDPLILGIDISKEELHKNIHDRLLKRMDVGLMEEVDRLHQGGLSFERLEDFGLEYRYVAQYLEGKLEKDEMLETLETKIRQYAKRQMTWLKRDQSIVWVDPSDIEMIEERVRAFLGSENEKQLQR